MIQAIATPIVSGYLFEVYVFVVWKGVVGRDFPTSMSAMQFHMVRSGTPSVVGVRNTTFKPPTSHVQQFRTNRYMRR